MNLLTKIMVFVVSIQVMILSAIAQNSGTQQNLTGRAGTFAVINAKIVTVSGATIENGTLVVRDGKIAAVGVNAAIPRGAERIDGKGLSVYPGMIDAGTNMGLLEIGNAVIGTVDVAETGNINPNAQAILGLNPHTSHINVTRVNGITTVLSMPSGGVISGQSAVINLNGTTQQEMAVVPNFSLVISFPPISTFAGFNPLTGPRRLNFSQAVKRRDNRVKELKKAFEQAARYAKVKEAYARDNTLPYPANDVKMDAMIPYIGGEKPIIFRAQRARDIRGVIKFVDDMKLKKAIILGGSEAWKVAGELKKRNMSVIFNRMHSNPLRQDDPYDEHFTAPLKMRKAGLSFCISTGNNGSNVRELPYMAGLAAAFGLSKEDALKSVTLFPAKMLGIDDSFGSIEVGKVANIVVTNGDILDVRTNIKHMFITGRKIPLTSRHTEFFDAFKDRKISETP